MTEWPGPVNPACLLPKTELLRQTLTHWQVPGKVIYARSALSAFKLSIKSFQKQATDTPVLRSPLPTSRNHVQLHRSLASRSQVYLLLYPHIPPSFWLPDRRRRLHSWLYRTRGALRVCPFEVGRPWLCRLHLRPARLWAHSTRPQEVGKRGLRSDRRRRPDFRCRMGSTCRSGDEPYSAPVSHGPFYGAPSISLHPLPLPLFLNSRPVRSTGRCIGTLIRDAFQYAGQCFAVVRNYCVKSLSSPH